MYVSNAAHRPHADNSKQIPAGQKLEICLDFAKIQFQIITLATGIDGTHTISNEEYWERSQAVGLHHSRSEYN